MVKKKAIAVSVKDRLVLGVLVVPLFVKHALFAMGTWSGHALNETQNRLLYAYVIYSYNSGSLSSLYIFSKPCVVRFVLTQI
jgi:hypothetical protein